MADETSGTEDEMRVLMDAASRGLCDGDGPDDVSDEFKAAHAGGGDDGDRD